MGFLWISMGFLWVFNGFLSKFPWLSICSHMLPSSNAWTTLAPWSLGREMPQEVNPGDAEPCRSILNPCANESISGKESTGKLNFFLHVFTFTCR
jgi:hypothetical protein